MEVLASWRRWIVYLEIIDNKKYCIKKALDESKKAAINKEIIILQKLEKHTLNFVPKIVEYGDGWFKYEYIPGMSFDKVIANANSIMRLKLVSQLLEKCYLLDKIWVIHWELIRPYSNVLVNNSEIYIIDFERGVVGDFSGRNIRSYSQWLTSNWFLNLSFTKSLWSLSNVDTMYNLVKLKLANTNQSIVIILTIGLLIFLDQITKFVFYDMRIFEAYWLISPALNKGISWSLPVPFYLIILVSFVALIAFVILYRKQLLNKLVFILLFSWTIWNLIDRILYHWVRDFIDLHYWPIFNVADMLLFFGVAYVFYLEFVKNNK